MMKFMFPPYRTSSLKLFHCVYPKEKSNQKISDFMLEQGVFDQWFYSSNNGDLS